MTRPGLAVTIGGGSADDWAAVIVRSTSKPGQRLRSTRRDRVPRRKGGGLPSVGDDCAISVGSDDSPANVFTGQVLSIRRDVRGRTRDRRRQRGRAIAALRLNRPTTGVGVT